MTGRIVVCDFEFAEDRFGFPVVRCVAFHDLTTGERGTLWADALSSSPPAVFTEDYVLVAFAAKAELSCFLALGWPFPPQVLDLFFLYKRVINGDPGNKGSGLLQASVSYGIQHKFTEVQKHHFQMLAAKLEHQYSEKERVELQEYCFEDVRVTAELYLQMAEEGLPPNAYHWGEYAKAQTAMELEGLPANRAKYECIRDNKEQLQRDVIDQLLADPRYEGVYQFCSFNIKGFHEFLNREGIAWPRLSSGQLDIRDETIKAAAELEPALVAIHETRKILSALRGLEQPLCADDCLRCYTSPFHTATGRNNPSSKVFIPGMPRAFRQLIQPPEGEALLYFDFGQQEILIMAALSGDMNLLATYAARDPYVKFGQDSRVLKLHETRETAPAKRDACKVFFLAVGYGMQSVTLAKKINADVPGINMTEYEASDLIYKHKRLYEVYWNWVGAYVEEALITGVAYTASGWAMHVMPKRNSKHPNWAPDINLRAIGNFPIQGTGSDILRVTCINLYRAGIRVAAPVHDAVFVRCKLEEIDRVKATTKLVMIDSAEEVLQCGIPIRVDCQVTPYPEFYPADLEGKNGKKPASGAKLWKLIGEKYFKPSGL
jgi:hypothetical protein